MHVCMTNSLCTLGIATIGNNVTFLELYRILVLKINLATYICLLSDGISIDEVLSIQRYVAEKQRWFTIQLFASYHTTG